MKIPRYVSAENLIKTLSKIGYSISRQKGSHIRLTKKIENEDHHITIPNHSPLKIAIIHF
jgi:predicted RNA binding protein YcfA (HicA-like mRNA interferase family)